MTKSVLRIGAVGAGFNFEFHIRALEFVRGACVTGIVDTSRQNAEKAASLASSLGVGAPVIYDSIVQMAESGEVDVIGIFNPNFARVETMEAIACARKAGAPISAVICEKPLGRNFAEAMRIFELVRSTDLSQAYFENQCHMPGVIKMRMQHAGNEQAMGPLDLARTAEEHKGPHSGWFFDPRRQGGGTWNDMGCHQVGIGEWMLTPLEKPMGYLQPISVSAYMALRKWGNKPWSDILRNDYGVDYDIAPAEDFANVAIEFADPETGHQSTLLATSSWMYEPGLRLQMEGLGPGYEYSFDSLRSPAGIFISDMAASAAANGELALEKAGATRGNLIIQPDEPGLYGYVGEWQDAVRAFGEGRNALLDFNYGVRVVKLVMAGYMAHEMGQVVDLTDLGTIGQLEKYVPKIQQGLGNEVLRAA